MKPWLSIIGVGEDGYEALSTRAKQLVTSAEVIVGSDRTLAMLPGTHARLVQWPQPFDRVIDQLKPLRGTLTTILATGDPSNYGTARKILSFIPKDEVTIVPHYSAFSLAAAVLGWSLPDCDCFTIHGRPAANLEGFIQPQARLLVLTQDGASVAEVCRRLVARGFGGSSVTVLENLGGPRQRVTQFIANEPPPLTWSPLNTVAIQCVAGPCAIILSRVGGLPDDAFENDGQITKREVRAATIAALAPAPDQLLWDIGAGSGSVSIEWMRSTRGCEAIAIEKEPARAARIARNADALGTPRLRVVTGVAPKSLLGLPCPDAVFIGGGIDCSGVFDSAWAALKVGGICVANTVTLEGDRQIMALQDVHGGDLVRMDVSILTYVGEMRALKPRMSVLQWRVRKVV